MKAEFERAPRPQGDTSLGVSWVHAQLSLSGWPPGASPPRGARNRVYNNLITAGRYGCAGTLNFGAGSLPDRWGNVQSATLSFESFTNLLQGSARTRPLVRHTSWNCPSARISPMMTGFLR